MHSKVVRTVYRVQQTRPACCIELYIYIEVGGGLWGFIYSTTLFQDAERDYYGTTGTMRQPEWVYNLKYVEEIFEQFAIKLYIYKLHVSGCVDV